MTKQTTAPLAPGQMIGTQELLAIARGRVSKRQLQQWDEMEVVPVEKKPRPGGGHCPSARQYSVDHLRAVLVIAQLRAKNLSLDRCRFVRRSLEMRAKKGPIPRYLVVEPIGRFDARVMYCETPADVIKRLAGLKGGGFVVEVEV